MIAAALTAAEPKGGVALKNHMSLAFWKRPRAWRRVAALILSVVLMGLGVALFTLVGFGTDPCSTFSLGVSGRTGLSFGHCQLMLNALLFIPVLLCDPSRIGLGTLANMVLVGYSADGFLWLLGTAVTPQSPMGVRLIVFLATMALFLLAAALYMAVDLGVAPYDALPQIIAGKARRLSFRTLRVIWDLTFLVLGFLMGATVGLTTLLTGFCMGPVIVAVQRKTEPWFR